MENSNYLGTEKSREPFCENSHPVYLFPHYLVPLQYRWIRYSLETALGIL